jgi:hypothetical protein
MPVEKHTKKVYGMVEIMMNFWRILESDLRLEFF